MSQELVFLVDLGKTFNVQQYNFYLDYKIICRQNQGKIGL